MLRFKTLAHAARDARRASRFTLALGCALAAPLAAGCSDGQADSSAPTSATPTAIREFASDASDAGVAAASPPPVAVAQTFQGSPLCQALYVKGCYPDDMINACDLTIDLTADGGLEATAAVGAACHVVASASGTTTGCLPAGLGLTSAACSRSTECAAGNECIGAGSCRHYCCAGTSACQVNEFCDVQPMAQSPTLLVPVCMPEVPCALLVDASCPASQQCSVVREDGSTSCVNVGTAQDGDLCDIDHCARGLVCIGAQGSPRCAPLCHTTTPNACADSQRTCVGTLPLFPDPTVGVCQ